MGFFDKIWNGAVDTITGPAEFLVDVVGAGRTAATGDFGGAAEQIVNSAQEDLLTQTIGGLFGPEGIGGALIGELPEEIRDPAGRVIDPVLGAWDWTVQELVDRPLGTVFTVLNATHQNGLQSLFEVETYAKAWEINDARTFGQAFAANLYAIDPFDEDEYNSIQDDPIFNLISGTADFIQEFADPVSIVGGTALKGARGSAVLGSASRPTRGALFGTPREITRVYGGRTGLRPQRFKTADQLQRRDEIIRSHTAQRTAAFIESRQYMQIEEVVGKLDSQGERAAAFRQVTGRAGLKMSNDAVELYANAATPIARARTMRALAGDLSVMKEIQDDASRLLAMMNDDDWTEVAQALNEPMLRERAGAATEGYEGDLAGTMFALRMQRHALSGAAEKALEFTRIADNTDWAVMYQFREALFDSQQTRSEFYKDRYLGYSDDNAVHLPDLANMEDGDAIMRAGLESILGQVEDANPLGIVSGQIRQLPWGNRLKGVLEKHNEILEQRPSGKYVLSEFHNPHTIGSRRGGFYGKAIRVITERTPQTHVFFDDPNAVSQFERVLTQATRVNVGGVTILGAEEAANILSAFRRFKMTGQADQMRQIYQNTVEQLNSRLDDAMEQAEYVDELDPFQRTLTKDYGEAQAAWSREAERAVGVTDDAGQVQTNRVLPDGSTVVINHRMTKSQVKNSAVQPRYDVVQRQVELVEARAKTGVKKVPVTIGDVSRGVVGRGRTALDGPQQAWRSLMLLTPKWPMRVGLDEQLRAAATLGGMTQIANLLTSFPELRRAFALHNLDNIADATDVEAVSRILREQTGVRTVSDQLDEITARLDEQLKEHGRVADMPDAVKAEREQLKKQQKVLSEQGDATQREAGRVLASAPPEKTIEFPETTATIEALEDAGGRWDFEDLSLEEQIEWHEAHGAGKNNPSRKYERDDLEKMLRGPDESRKQDRPNIIQQQRNAIEVARREMQDSVDRGDHIYKGRKTDRYRALEVSLEKEQRVLAYLENTPIAQIEQDVIRAFRNIINDPDTRIAVAMDPSTVAKVKTAGVFKTTAETGGVLEGAASSFDVRRQYETGIGIPANLALELRPSSGVVVPGAFVRQARKTIEKNYGSVVARVDGVPTGGGKFQRFKNQEELVNIYNTEVKPVLLDEFGVSGFDELASDADRIAWGDRTDELMAPHASFDNLTDEAKELFLKEERGAIGLTGVNTYGSATILLDPKVLERTKFTYGDSFNTQGNVASMQNASDQAILNMAFGRAGSKHVKTVPQQSTKDILSQVALGNPEKTLGLLDLPSNAAKYGIDPSKMHHGGTYLEALTYGRWTLDEIASADYQSALTLGIEPRSMLASTPTASLQTRVSSLSLFDLYEMAGPDAVKDAVRQLSREKVLSARQLKERKSNVRRLGRNAALKGAGVGALIGNPVVGAVYGTVAYMSKRRNINRALERKAALNYASALRHEGTRLLREAVGRDEIVEARRMIDDATHIKQLIESEDAAVAGKATQAKNAFDAAEQLMQDAGVAGLQIGGMSFRNAFGDDPRYQEQIRANVSASRSQSAVYSGALRDAERQLRRFQDADFKVWDAVVYDKDGVAVNTTDIRREWLNMMNRYTSPDLSQEFYAIVWSNDEIADRIAALQTLLALDQTLYRNLTSKRFDDLIGEELHDIAANIVLEYENVLPSPYFNDLREMAQDGDIPPWKDVTNKLMDDPSLGDGTLASKIEEMRKTRPGFGKAVAPEPVSHDGAMRRGMTGKVAGWAEDLFKMFGTLPTDELARNPFFRTRYERELRRRVALLTDPDGNVRLSQKQIDELEQQARDSALGEVREVMYDLAENTRISEMVGNSMPFFNAWQEVLGRWAGFAAENPTFVGNMARLYRKPWDAEALGISEVTVENDDGTDGPTYLMFRPFGPAYDSDGNETTIFDAMSPAIRNLLIPKMLQDQDATIRFSKDGLNTITSAPLPGFGPLITIPVREAILERPGLEETFGFMFPFGHPEGGFFERAVKGNLPTWAKSVDDYLRDSQTRDRLVQRMFQDIVVQRAEAGDPLDWGDDLEVNAAIELANDRARDFSMFRIAAGFFSPTSTTLLSPYEPMVQEARRLQREHGTLEGNSMFLELYGEDFFALTARMTQLNDGVAASIESEELYEQHQDLVQAHPEIGAWVTASLGSADEEFVFSQAVYRRQMNMQIAPGADETRRSRKTPLEALTDTQAELGWKAYTELADYKRSKQEEAIAAGMSGSMNAGHMRPLAAYMGREIEALRAQYPAWAVQFDDFGSSTRRLGEVMDGFVAGLQDEQLLQRPSTRHVIDYFELRMYVQERLQERGAQGGSDNIRARSNEDLLLYWEQSKEQLSLMPEFSAIYDRFFERDSLARQTFIDEDAFKGLF